MSIAEKIKRKDNGYELASIGIGFDMYGDQPFDFVAEIDEFYPDTFSKIRQWASDRNLINGATPAAQFEKLGEEFGELGRALVEDDPAKTKDAIGDMIVVLTIMSAQLNMSVEECIDAAYDEIKDRKGKMVDGIFVKEV